MMQEENTRSPLGMGYQHDLNVAEMLEDTDNLSETKIRMARISIRSLVDKLKLADEIITSLEYELEAAQHSQV